MISGKFVLNLSRRCSLIKDYRLLFSRDYYLLYKQIILQGSGNEKGDYFGISNNAAGYSIFTRLCSNSSSDEGRLPLGTMKIADAIYTPEKSAKILKYLNRKSVEQLLKMKLSVNVAERIVAERPLESLNQAAAVLDMDVIRFTTFCQTLLKKKNFRKHANTLSLCYPPLTPVKANNMKLVTSIDLNFKHTVWLQMDIETKAVIWGGFHPMKYHVDDKSNLVSVYDHKKYYEEVDELVQTLPETDAYLIEMLQAHAAPSYIPVKNAIQLLFATFSCYLMSRRTDVYMFKRSLVDRTFKLTVGTERISAADVVDKIESTGSHGNIEVGDMDVFKILRQSGPEEGSRDIFNLLYLQCIAFISKIQQPKMELFQNETIHHSAESSSV